MSDETPNLFDPPPEEVLPEMVHPSFSDRELSIQQKFEVFHTMNKWVYEELHRMAIELLDSGKKGMGIGMLFEVLRWRYMRATVDPNSSFKLNNDYRSRYVRMLMDNEPRLMGVFETRKLRSR